MDQTFAKKKQNTFRPRKSSANTNTKKECDKEQSAIQINRMLNYDDPDNEFLKALDIAMTNNDNLQQENIRLQAKVNELTTLTEFLTKKYFNKINSAPIPMS